MRNFTSEIKLLLTLSKIKIPIAEISNIENLITSVNDWNFFLECTFIHGITSLVSKNLKSYKEVPEKIRILLNHTYHITLRKNVVLYDALQKILYTFARYNVAAIPLKGIYLAETLYKDIGLRQMSDIDLLLKESDVNMAIDLLTGLGFVASGRIKSKYINSTVIAKHMPTMVKNGVLVEIHFRILIDDSHQSVNIDDFWKNANPVKLSGTETMALSIEDLLQYLCIHLERHLNEGKIQLYQFVDIIGLLDNTEKIFNWDAFLVSCENNKCMKSVFRILCLLHQYFSITFPNKIHQLCQLFKEEKTEQLFEYLLNCDIKGIAKLTENQNLKNLRKLDGGLNKLRFLIEDILPSISFMMKRYHIRFKLIVIPFYIYRMMKGIYLLLIHFYRKLFPN